MNLQIAIALAVKAHEGQFEKAGQPYILHPLRVMMSLRTAEEMIVGVLHDVVEDCADRGYTWQRLSDEGFSQTVIDALRSVTKTPEEELELAALSGEERVNAYLKFVSRAKKNKIGSRVKRADVFDNMNIMRIGFLQQRDIERLNQYKRAIEFLDE